MIPFLLSILAGLLPMLFFAWLLYRLDRFEREPFILLAAVFAWGAVIAAGFAFIINTFFNVSLNWILSSKSAATLTVSTLIAPPVEETLKGLAVLLVFLLFRTEFDSILDGILYAGVTALGFAAAENTLYIYQHGYLEGGWQGFAVLTAIRVLLVGWQHPFYTAFIGIGLAIYRSSRHYTLQWIAPLTGWIAAILLHTLHNLFAALTTEISGLTRAAAWDWTGYLGLLIYLLLLRRQEKRWLRRYLEEEISFNTLSQEQFEAISSGANHLLLLLKARLQGRGRKMKKFIQLCGELMHRKRHLAENIALPQTSPQLTELRKQIQTLGSDLPV